MKTKVIGCPKTIDGDLKCKEVPTSFGFDTACRVSIDVHTDLCYNDGNVAISCIWVLFANIEDKALSLLKQQIIK